jgi:hypothetical protein
VQQPCSNPSKSPEILKNFEAAIGKFAGILQAWEMSGKLSQCLHAAEDAGSIPASPAIKISVFTGMA